jgi:uncharacterized membrane protein YdjX (TVP38/TMEM64 family)
MRKHIAKLNYHAKHNHHIIGIIITIITIFFINKFIKLEYIGVILNESQDFFTQNIFIGIVIFTILCITILNSPISITPTLYVLSGFLYGAIFGTIISVITFTLASFIGFKLVRKYFRKKFQNKYKKKISSANKEIINHGFHYFFTLRTIVVVPHYLITILAGLSKLNTKTFLSSSILGFMPEAIVYNFAGSTLTNLTNINQIMSKEVIIALSLIVALGLIPATQKILRNRRIRKTKVQTFEDKPMKIK